MIHLIEPEGETPTHRHKRKTVEIIATLRLGHAMSARELADHCDMRPSNVSSTLDLLLEHELIRYVGKGPQPKNGGHRPALWRWV